MGRLFIERNSIQNVNKALSIFVAAILSVSAAFSQSIEGELKKWHKITLKFEGPECSEKDEYNPFLNYRLDVTFTHEETGKAYRVPGYFAADGDSGNTSAESGNVWAVNFAPDEVGEWDYSVSFKKGKWIAVRVRTEDPEPSGEYMDGLSGSFDIEPTDKTGRDFRAHGRLQYVGKPYLRFAETGEIFYKCGPDAPENFLSYYAFDGDFATDGHKDELVKTWEAHLADWNVGDPVWMDTRGKEMIGAINYLASKGMNSVSFLTNNIEADDQNVFPYIDYYTYDRFDCSKLDQWEVVFSHAQKLGLFLHFKLLEVENQGLLDNGGIGIYMRLYFREIIARYGHHLALNWNLCEEVGDWGGNLKKYDLQPTPPLLVENRQALSKFVRHLDPYDHHMVIHNGEWFTELYGDQSELTGASLQTTEEDFSLVNPRVQKILKESRAAGNVWAVAVDEPGHWAIGVMPDEDDPNHYLARTNALWGGMLAGAWGTEWYFGSRYAHSDHTCQDYRSRDLFWDQGKICIDFFAAHGFPVDEMVASNDLLSGDGDFCFAKEGEVYIALLSKGGEQTLKINRGGKYTIRWFNPRTGGELQLGGRTTLSGKGEKSLGAPPSDRDKDWVVVIRKL